MYLYLYLYIYMYIYVNQLISLKNTTQFHMMSQRNASFYLATTESRCSHRWYSVKKGVLKNFIGKHLCWSLFLIKLQAFRKIKNIKYSPPMHSSPKFTRSTGSAEFSMVEATIYWGERLSCGVIFVGGGEGEELSGGQLRGKRKVVLRGNSFTYCLYLQNGLEFFN